MTTDELSLWITVPAALLLIVGGLVTLVGSLGLLRLTSFYARMHGASMGGTLGTGCVLLASILISSALAQRPVLHEVLITVFIVMTAPVTSMLIMRAAIYRTGVNAQRKRPPAQSVAAPAATDATGGAPGTR